MTKKKTIRKFTLTELTALWTEYKFDFCFRYLVNGEWKYSDLKPEQEPKRVITKINRCRYREVMSFPEYLRAKHV